MAAKLTHVQHQALLDPAYRLVSDAERMEREADILMKRAAELRRMGEGLFELRTALSQHQGGGRG